MIGYRLSLHILSTNHKTASVLASERIMMVLVNYTLTIFKQRGYNAHYISSYDWFNFQHYARYWPIARLYGYVRNPKPCLILPGAIPFIIFAASKARHRSRRSFMIISVTSTLRCIGEITITTGFRIKASQLQGICNPYLPSRRCIWSWYGVYEHCKYSYRFFKLVLRIAT